MSETYCQFVQSGRASDIQADYHNQEYGVPTREESVLFERLTLETFQAGLSWEIVLKKRKGFFEAFQGFDVDKVAAYSEIEIEGFIQNTNVIRNRKKVEAAIYNAQAVQKLREEFGGFAEWLDYESNLETNEWIPAFKKRFKFMGGEVVGEFLISLGLIPGAHDDDCPTGKLSHCQTWSDYKLAQGGAQRSMK